MMKRVLALGVVLILALPARAQSGPEASFLQWSSEVGRLLYGYYAALDVARVAVSNRSDTLPSLYAGGPYEAGWAFSFGELDAHAEFVITHGVIVDGEGGIVRQDVFDRRRVASPYHTIAARALAAVRVEFGGLSRSPEFTADAYRFAVLPLPDHQVTVFVSPEQTRTGVSLVGNEVMYVVSRSDLSIEPVTRFHHRLLELPFAANDSSMAVLLVPDAPLPSPIDVLNTLERGAPLLVSAGRGAYLIASDGSIRALEASDPLMQAIREAGADAR
jgi:hypothetical protein